MVEPAQKKRRIDDPDDDIEDSDQEQTGLLGLPFELILEIVEELPLEILPWVREVCRKINEAVEYIYKNCKIERYSPLRRKTWEGAVWCAAHTKEGMDRWHAWRRADFETRWSRYPPEGPLDYAAEIGNAESFKLLLDDNWTWLDPMREAAMGGHIAIFETLTASAIQGSRGTASYRPTVEHVKAAAINGHIAVLKYMIKSMGARIGPTVCASAAAGGQLNVIRWLREIGCSWTANTCTLAAYHGHINVLRYAHENGCPWDESTYTAAVHMQKYKKDSACLTYLQVNGCPAPRSFLS